MARALVHDLALAYLTSKSSFNFDFVYADELCAYVESPLRASIVFLAEISILPGDLELPGHPTLLPHGDKDVTRVVGPYNITSHDGKFGSRPGCKLHHV